MLKALKVFTLKHYKIIFYLWFFLALVLSQMLVKSYLSYQAHIDSIKNQSLNTNILMTAQVSNLFNKMEIILNFVKSIVENEDIWERTKLENYLRKFQNSHKEIQTLKVFDKNGNYFADTLPTLSKQNVSDRDYFQSQKNSETGSFSISGPLLSKSTGKNILVLSNRINSKDGSFKGVVVITIEITYFKNLFEEASIGPNGNISLFYKTNQLVARIPWKPELVGTVINGSTDKSYLNEDKSPTKLFSAPSAIDGIDRLYSLNKLDNTDFELYVGLSLDEHLRDWKRASLTDLTFFIFISIISHFITIIYCLSLDKIETQKLNIFRASKMTTLGEMSSQLAHEINNPLTIIKSAAFSLNKILNSEKIDLPKATDYLAKIDKTTTRITKIISGLRAFSRAGDNDPFEQSSLHKLFQDITELSSHRLKMAQVKFEIAPFDDILFECKASQIEQVLLNLLNNSIDGIIELPDKWIKINVSTQKDKIFISFTDSGTGIPKDVAERIMEPFYTTKAVGKGTGLGLSISKGLIEGHQGKLTYNSESSHTQFIIEIPISQKRISNETLTG